MTCVLTQCKIGMGSMLAVFVYFIYNFMFLS